MWFFVVILIVAVIVFTAIAVHIFERLRIERHEIETMREILQGSSSLEYPTLAKAAAPLMLYLREHGDRKSVAVVEWDSVHIMKPGGDVPAKSEKIE